MHLATFVPLALAFASLINASPFPGSSTEQEAGIPRADLAVGAERSQLWKDFEKKGREVYEALDKAIKNNKKDEPADFSELGKANWGVTTPQLPKTSKTSIKASVFVHQ